MTAHVINPDLQNINFSFPFLAATVLPSGVAFIVLIAGLSATMSSASSDAIASVSIFLCDIYSSLVFNNNITNYTNSNSFNKASTFW